MGGKKSGDSACVRRRSGATRASCAFWASRSGQRASSAFPQIESKQHVPGRSFSAARPRIARSELGRSVCPTPVARSSRFGTRYSHKRPAQNALFARPLCSHTCAYVRSLLTLQSPSAATFHQVSARHFTARSERQVEEDGAWSIWTCTSESVRGGTGNSEPVLQLVLGQSRCALTLSLKASPMLLMA